MQFLGCKPSRFPYTGGLLLGTAVLVGIGAQQGLRPHVAGGEAPEKPAADQYQVKQSYGALPLAFVKNEGQLDPAIRFSARGAGYSLALTGNEAVLALRRPDPGAKSASAGKQRAAVLRMKLEGANPKAKVRPEEKLPGVSNFYLGADPAKWRAGVPEFAKVKYDAVYPGVDMVYYGNQGTLEYDFNVAPGAKPDQIQVAYAGADKVEVDGRGDLLVSISGGSVRMEKPVAYQEVSGERREVAAAYAIDGNNVVHFELGDYDATRPLVIDPKLKYSGYAGGTQFDRSYGIAVDSTGQAFASGETESSAATFPAVNAAQAANGGGRDAFVIKLNAAGTAALYRTYLGGTGGELGRGIDVDSTGSAIVVGYTTSSTTFPKRSGGVNGAVKFAYAGGTSDGFITKLTSAGALEFSTFIGTTNEDNALDVTVDDLDNIYVCGLVKATGLPTTAGVVKQTHATVDRDGFVIKLDNSNVPNNIWCTYYGANGANEGFQGIAVDGNYNVYVCGDAGGGFANIGGVGTNEALVVKLNSTATALSYAIGLIGGAEDVAAAVSVDTGGNTYVSGWTKSNNFPVYRCLDTGTFTGNTLSGSQDAFAVKLDASTTGVFDITASSVALGTRRPVYSTYLGGQNAEDAYGGKVDSNGRFWVSGSTNSPNHPRKDQVYSYSGGSTDAFVSVIENYNGTDPNTNLYFSTYIGGTGTDTGYRIDVSGITGNPATAGICWLAGTAGTGFPTIAGSWDTTFGAGGTPAADGFVLRLSSLPNLPPVIDTCPAPICVSPGGSAPLTMAFTEPNGDAVTITWTVDGTLVRTTNVALSTLEPSSGGDTLNHVYPSGVHTVVVTVTDGEATPVSCSTTVASNDQPPTINLPPDQLDVPNDPGECFAHLNAGMATATAACPGVGVTVSGVRERPDGSTTMLLEDDYEIGTHTITWTATDSFGNTGSDIQIISVVDVEAPVLTCPPSVTTSVDPGEDFATLDVGELGVALASATDNCPPAFLIAFRNTSGLADTGDPADLAGIYGAGTHTITWIAMDLFLNFAICEQRVTVLDGSEVTSEFEASDEGWTVDAPASLARLTSDGDPGAHLRSLSVAGTDLYFNAPAAYHGNHLSKYGKLLEFTLKQDGDGGDLVSDVDVILSDGTTTLSLALTAPDATQWTRYQAYLTETGGWVKSGGATPTQAEVETVLSNITSLKIRARWSSGFSVTDLDSVFFGAYYAAP